MINVRQDQLAGYVFKALQRVRHQWVRYRLAATSVDPGSLKGMRKYQNLKAGFSRYGEAVGQLREYGLQTWAAFTLGHDHDTEESLWETLEFARKSRFAFAASGKAACMGETEGFMKVITHKETGRILDGGFELGHCQGLVGPVEVARRFVNSRRTA